MTYFAVANHTQHRRSIGSADLSAAPRIRTGNCTILGAVLPMLVDEGTRGMARVNYEQEFFERRRTIRLDQAAKVAGPSFTATRISGCLGFLWNCTQAEMQLVVTPEEVVAFSYDVTDEEGPQYIAGLLAGRFLRAASNVTFIVTGNVKQIDGLVNRMRSMRGGQEKYEAWQKIRSDFLLQYPTEQRDVNVTLERQVDGTCTHNSIQFNSIQLNSNQIKNSLPPTLVPPPPSTSGAESSPKKKVRFSESDLAIATQWAEWAKEVSSTVRPNLESWADVFRKMREIDKVPEEELPRMLDFARADDFWCANVASADRLRSRSKNGLLKHENLRTKMNRPAGKKAGKGMTEQDWAEFEERERNGSTGL